MEPSPHEEKENTPGFRELQPNFQLFHNPNLQFVPTNLQKKTKNHPQKPKPQKGGFASNLRVGDWVCLVCNNLNFSFRNECNRCQTQTKEQNQIQSLRILGDPNHPRNKDPERFAFQDLTNQIYLDSKPGHVGGLHNKSKSTPMENELAMNLILQMQRQPVHVTKGSDGANSSDQNNNNGLMNSGFKNMLLVTPPKHRQNKSLNIFKEYSDSSQKEFPPYKSPEHLPSVSPMLKRVFGYDFKEGENRPTDKNSYAKYISEEAERVNEDQEDDEEGQDDHEEQVRRNILGENLFGLNQSRNMYRMKEAEQGGPRLDLGLFASVNTRNLRGKQPGNYLLDDVEERLQRREGKN